jgi:hypothetical protein
MEEASVKLRKVAFFLPHKLAGPIQNKILLRKTIILKSVLRK